MVMQSLNTQVRLFHQVENHRPVVRRELRIGHQEHGEPQRRLIVETRNVPELIHPIHDGACDLAVELCDDGEEERVGTGQLFHRLAFPERITDLDPGSFTGEQGGFPDGFALAE